MLDELRNTWLWSKIGWIVMGIAILVVIVKNWSILKPVFSKVSRCLHKHKTNQAMLEDHEVKLAEIQRDVKSIKTGLTELEENSREYRKTSLSDKIFKKYQRYKKLGYVSRDEIVNFNICVDRYRKCIDEIEFETDIVINKYLKEVMCLEIRDKGE